VKRFDIDMCGDMEPDVHGDWVRGDEAEAEIAKRDARIAELEAELALRPLLESEAYEPDPYPAGLGGRHPKDAP
jgi:hypothetical protein